MGFLVVYFRERKRKRQSVSRGGTEREGVTVSKAGSRLCLSAQSPMWDFNSWAVRSWPELKLMLNQRSHPGTLFLFFVVFLFVFFLMFIYFRERGGKGHRERETKHVKPTLCWQQRTWLRTQVHKPQDHDLSWSWVLNLLSLPVAPVSACSGTLSGLDLILSNFASIFFVCFCQLYES